MKRALLVVVISGDGSCGHEVALQARGRRFDLGWLHWERLSAARFFGPAALFWFR